MTRADLSEIIQKYKKLFGSNASSEDTRAAQTDLQRDLTSATAASSQPIKSNADVQDAFLDPDRFIRTPIEQVSQEAQKSEVGYEHFMVNSLFAAVDQDEYLDPSSVLNRQEFFEQNALKLDILAAGLAWRLIQYDQDLKQMYDPSMGMYPTQAFYTPKSHIFKWGGAPKEKPIRVKPEMDAKKVKGKPNGQKEIQNRNLIGKSIKVVKKKKEPEDEREKDKLKKKKEKKDWEAP